MDNLSPFCLTMGVAAAFILLGGGLLLKTLRFRAKAQLVDARLIKREEFGALREDGLLAVRLSYQYAAPDGRNIQANRTSLLRNTPPIGSIRTMLVDPEKPKSLQSNLWTYHRIIGANLVQNVQIVVKVDANWRKCTRTKPLGEPTQSVGKYV